MKKLKAGPITLEYSEGSLWNISNANEEIIRRIYLVFQDINWTSRPFVIKKEDWQVNADSFSAKIEMQGTHDAQSLAVELVLTGSESGEISYGFSGSSAETFLKNRLGLCLLHPVATLAGKKCNLIRPDGLIEESQFPAIISPNQPFLNLAGISHKLESGTTATVNFDGEIFETEDHRNWSDASYKTYCTPISLPFPAPIEAGVPIKQSIRVSFDGNESKSLEVMPGKKILISVLDELIPLPKIGLGVDSDASHLNMTEYEGFEDLGIEHLRLALNCSSASKSDVEKALAITQRLDINLDLALTAENPEQARNFLGSIQDLNARIRTTFLFSSKDKTTPADFVDAAYEVIADKTKIAGGTDLYFTELNRNPECVSFVEQINFSINPQVHSFDDRTLVQNTATQKTIGINAARLAPDKKISVGPITLRPRYNPNATQPDKDVSNTALPSSVDARQRTWFAEAWTAMSLRSISDSKAISTVTYFQTLGWRGIKELSLGSQDLVNFPSKPGEKFPIWSFFAALKGFTHMRPTASTSPESVDCLLVKSEGLLKVILVNFSTIEQEVYFSGIDLSSKKLNPESVTYMEIKGARNV
jgi:hypothetical protein